MNISNFPWVFALIVFFIAFGVAYLAAQSRALNPTLGDTLIAMTYSSMVPGILVVWFWWWASV